jgi:hypothetical protein
VTDEIFCSYLLDPNRGMNRRIGAEQVLVMIGDLTGPE